MLFEFSLSTGKEEMINITSEIQNAIKESGVNEGFCIVYCPHTTAGITINENADPDVVTDILFGLDKAFPDRPEFRHYEGNSAAHIKSSVIGTEKSIIISKGNLVLGRWQGVYFCEFDSPRTRTFYVKISS
ncbi:MAG: secondary thiamine-phosphate synthase enzyme YjbQ [Ruminococcus sp.]|nr:secondary thiamine-phosphate synthase enzyme YjbQ [Ruminococcus sp.]